MGGLILHTRGDGVLGDTTAANVRDMAAQIARSSRAVIHIHGGLVSKTAGITGANRLGPHYTAGNVLSVFPVWESGILEAVRNNAKELFDEKLFQVLLKRLIKHVGGKLADAAAGRAAGGAYQPLSDRDAKEALEQAQRSLSNDTAPEPLSKVPVNNIAASSAEPQATAFEDELTSSTEFQEAFDSIMIGLGAPVPPGARAAAAGRGAAKTLLSESIVRELRQSTTPAGGRGFFDPVVIVKHAAVVFAKTVKRFIQRRDHGLYTTIVEELCRELYAASIGGWVWARMKKDTLDTFVDDDGAPRGGALLLEELGAQLRARVAANASLPQLSLVAHSAGSMWACHFLEKLREHRASGAIPAGFCIDRLVFMAPAVSCKQFAKTLELHAATPLFREFRMFSLSDTLEAGYWEAPPLYPRSLLYLISGVLEQTSDMPILGMARYFDDRDEVYGEDDVQAIRAFLTDPKTRAVWSKVTGGDGLNSDALRHGAFDDDKDDNSIGITMASVMHVLTN